MYRIGFLIVGVIFFTAGCATITEKNRMAGFEEISKAYERIMLGSKFETAHGFTDPKSVRKGIEFTAYKGIKIVEYRVKEGWVSDDKLVVNQIVEMKYYRIDRLVVRTIRYEQLWKYDDLKNTWLLQTGLPELK